jgi:hypothetical protein
MEEEALWISVSDSRYRAAISAGDLLSLSVARKGNARTGQPIIDAKYLTKYWSITPCLNCR